MPKHLAARLPLDALEKRQVRKLAHSVHAPADWILRRPPEDLDDHERAYRAALSW